ncbi:hypothetical protein SJ05684_a41050 (plasmid) [Sinorhizobium sojae CCBAU 05684]|uniref:Uncharacterized protein n=1 Tax=Sinorhizobium sojae CCBAU 05684 TaxID=716928 RepID=A0A249PNB0_9HYPH|nr:hypothetical protein SS05631_a49400 [Sinorhizobium sp. CCBAU 05631]ASY67418.1 hypothetical protein SJ05684_a41050 [Sinorhizobium sojae CCBAU 05684]
MRHDPVLAPLSERLTPKRQDSAVRAGKSTVNRLEHGRTDRDHKIAHAGNALEALFVELIEAGKEAGSTDWEIFQSFCRSPFRVSSLVRPLPSLSASVILLLLHWSAVPRAS